MPETNRPTLFEHARVLTPFAELEESVLVDDGQIVRLGGEPPPDALRLNLEGNWLIPGLIDLHVHGGSGAQFTSGSIDECLEAARFHAQHGTTALLATMISAPRDQLLEAVNAVAQAAIQETEGSSLLGCHLEGPFLNPERCGAMNPAFMRPPDQHELRSLIDVGGGWVRMVAVAPELVGALELVSFASQQGIIPALGHSESTYEQANAAIDAGARHAVHLFNAMRPFRHREPGIVGAVLARPEVTCELIADGYHVHPVALRLGSALKGAMGTVLVTDAVEAAGMPDGTYRLGETEIRVSEGRAMLAGRDSLAGSTLTMAAAVRGAVDLIGLPLSDAVAMATATPARVLGLDDQIGRITAGCRADLVILDDQLNVLATIRGGRFIHGSADRWA